MIMHSSNMMFKKKVVKHHSKDLAEEATAGRAAKIYMFLEP